MARTLTSSTSCCRAIRRSVPSRAKPSRLRPPHPTFEHLKIERARQFHRDLVDHHVKNRGTAGYGDLVAKSIVGIGQPTIEVGSLLPNGTLAIDRDAVDGECDGDGNRAPLQRRAPAAAASRVSGTTFADARMLIADRRSTPTSSTF